VEHEEKKQNLEANLSNQEKINNSIKEIKELT
jgi:hypothetical protein